MTIVDKVLSTKPSRRTFLAGAGAAGVSALVAGCSDNSSSSNNNPNPPAAAPVTDADILTFALNLEYLEAEFYLRAVTGSGLGTADGSGTVTGGTKVPFVTPAFAAYAAEIASNELDHVRAIRATLQAMGATPITAPAIDFGAFAVAATAAGIKGSAPFNPFADETSFLLGSFLFEDVGVTAYTGAAALISDKAVLNAAAGIQAVEAYHAGELRTIIANLGGAALTAANQISALRGTLGGGGETSLSIGSATSASTIAAADGSGLAYGRGVDQVLHIVYATGGGSGVSSGGFFPSGLNGNIKTTAS